MCAADINSINSLILHAIGFIRDVLLLKGANKILHNSSEIDVDVEHLNGRISFWRACRDSLTPALLSWLNAPIKETKTRLMLAQTIGMLCQPGHGSIIQITTVSSSISGVVTELTSSSIQESVARQRLKSVDIAKEFDYVSKLVRILKLKCQEDLASTAQDSQRQRTQVVGGTAAAGVAGVGNPLLALTAIVDMLVCISYSNRINSEQWSSFTQLTCNDWYSFIATVLCEDESPTTSWSSAAPAPAPVTPLNISSPLRVVAIDAIGLLLFSLRKLPRDLFVDVTDVVSNDSSSSSSSSEYASNSTENEGRKRKLTAVNSSPINAAIFRSNENVVGSHRLIGHQFQFPSSRLQELIMQQITFGVQPAVGSLASERHLEVVYSAIKSVSLAASFGNTAGSFEFESS